MGLAKVHLGLDSVWGGEQAELWKEEVSVWDKQWEKGRKAAKVSGGKGKGSREFLCIKEEWRVARESNTREREVESLYLCKNIKRCCHRWKENVAKGKRRQKQNDGVFQIRKCNAKWSKKIALLVWVWLIWLMSACSLLLGSSVGFWREGHINLM